MKVLEIIRLFLKTRTFFYKFFSFKRGRALPFSNALLGLFRFI
ncbi:hypothetical protein HMPREF1344_02308 [Enterococcus faecalis R508]|uniref:Uncharacterized protein n=1 Tax=Enterococcus faecalis RP2S-4 TaxID=1244145 RepID=A0ABC9TIK8_ENTFL|nr:hypothetical protein HMPREF9515_03038 [Enterococcus faecalis TX0860]EJV36019.1 hypothetical protein HMPREF1344_02308 [Enterococcus faecalis R508]EPI08177.1 hypothetical protein D358_01608 [Enterococcus faecalis RP2S-4]EPI25134.1 hypothetical protein D354_00535 [Enterococcus faecalis]EPI29152.1 hypothetical protein D351_01524 [Enterococcus faecalis WKS-26-18-2]